MHANWLLVGRAHKELRQSLNTLRSCHGKGNHIISSHHLHSVIMVAIVYTYTCSVATNVKALLQISIGWFSWIKTTKRKHSY